MHLYALITVIMMMLSLRVECDCTIDKPYPLVYGLAGFDFRAQYFMPIDDGSKDMLLVGEFAVGSTSEQISLCKQYFSPSHCDPGRAWVSRVGDNGTFVWSAALNSYYTEFRHIQIHGDFAYLSAQHWLSRRPLIFKMALQQTGLVANVSFGLEFSPTSGSQFSLGEFDFIVVNDETIYIRAKGSGGLTQGSNSIYISRYFIPTASYELQAQIDYIDPITTLAGALVSKGQIGYKTQKLYMGYQYKTATTIEYGLMALYENLTFFNAITYLSVPTTFRSWTTNRLEFSPLYGHFLPFFNDNMYYFRFGLNDLLPSKSFQLSSIRDATMTVKSDSVIYYSYQIIGDYHVVLCKFDYTTVDNQICRSYMPGAQYNSYIIHQQIALFNGQVIFKYGVGEGALIDSRFEVIISKYTESMDPTPFMRMIPAVVSGPAIGPVTTLNTSFNDISILNITAFKQVATDKLTYIIGILKFAPNPDLYTPLYEYYEGEVASNDYGPFEQPTEDIIVLKSDPNTLFLLNVKFTTNCVRNIYNMFTTDPDDIPGAISLNTYIDGMQFYDAATSKSKYNWELVPPQLETTLFLFQGMASNATNKSPTFKFIIQNNAPQYLETYFSLECVRYIPCTPVPSGWNNKVVDVQGDDFDCYNDWQTPLIFTKNPIDANGWASISIAYNYTLIFGADGQAGSFYFHCIDVLGNKVDKQEVRFRLKENDPPNFATTPLVQQISECQPAINYTLPVCTDPDGKGCTVTSTMLSNSSPFPAFISFDDTTLTFSYNPVAGDGDAAGKIYTQKITLTDGDGQNQNINYDVNVTTAYTPTFVTPFLNMKFTVPDNIDVDLGASFIDRSDLKGVVMDGASVITWLTFDEVTHRLKLTNGTSTNNTLVGTYSLKIELDYSSCGYKYLQPTPMPLTISLNQAPVALGPISTYHSIIQGQNINISIPNPAFNDPENNASLFIEHQSIQGPYLAPIFLLLDPGKDWIYFEPNPQYSGQMLISYRIVDNINQTAIISHYVTVETCYYGCKDCSDIGYDQCTQCKEGFYLHSNSCSQQCEYGYFPNQATQTCDLCHPHCSSCTGSDPLTQCTECAHGKLKYQGGCVTTCPTNYFSDFTSGSCLRCFAPCTQCFGPDYNECTACNATMQHVKSHIATECIRLECLLDGQYEDLVSLTCKDCIPHCKICQDGTTCDECMPHYEYTNGSCVHCSATPGYYVDEDGFCETKCGDGIRVGIEGCDDNNTVSFDGCDKFCRVEDGYQCPVGGKCVENVLPKVASVKVSKFNLITFEFTEKVYIEKDVSFTKDKFFLQIKGPNPPYPFSWDFGSIGDVTKLGEKGELRWFFIRIFDIGNTLNGDGEEQLSLSFLNASTIKDKAGNKMRNEQVSTDLKPYEFYPQNAHDIAEQIGKTAKILFACTLVIQLVMNYVLDASAALVWSITHLMQVFNFLLLINLNIPFLLYEMGRYLRLASGDIPEYEDFIPSFFSLGILDAEQVVPEEFTLQEKMNNINMESPIVAVELRSMITIFQITIFVYIPLSYMCAKKSKGCQDLFSTFFWNNPIRTVLELFLELSFMSLLNMQYLGYDPSLMNISLNYSFVIGMIAITITLFFPFTILHIIGRHYGKHHTQTFNDQYGALTEDFKVRLQISPTLYYVVFVSQRFLISFTLVFLYEYPLVQCGILIMINLSSILYIAKVRPYNDERLQFLEAKDSACIMLIVCIFISFKWELTLVPRIVLSFVVIGIFMCSFMISIIVFVLDANSNIRESVKRSCCKDEKVNIPSDQKYIDKHPNLMKLVKQLQKQMRDEENQGYMDQITYIQPQEVVNDYTIKVEQCPEPPEEHKPDEEEEVKLPEPTNVHIELTNNNQTIDDLIKDIVNSPVRASIKQVSHIDVQHSEFISDLNREEDMLKKKNHKMKDRLRMLQRRRQQLNKQARRKE